jgi:hypothetical protein
MQRPLFFASGLAAVAAMLASMTSQSFLPCAAAAVCAFLAGLLLQLDGRPAVKMPRRQRKPPRPPEVEP